MGREVIEALRASGSRWERAFLPDSLGPQSDSINERYRARLLVWSITATPIGVALVLGLNHASGQPARGADTGSALILLCALGLLPLLRRGVRVGTAALWFAALLTAAAFVPVWAYQGRAPATLFLTMFPAIVMVMVGLRSGIVWCGIVILGLFGVGIASELRPDLAVPIPLTVQVRWLVAVPCLFTLFLTVFVALLETSRSRALAELHASRAALQDSETRFRAIFEAAPVGMGMFETDGRTLEANPRGREMLGIAAGGELHESALLRCVHPADAERAYRFFGRALRGAVDPPLEYRWVQPNGRVEWARASASLVRGADGAVRFVVGTAEFITARKDAEERIKVLAFFDGVTGLANRSLFVERLSRALELAERRKHPLAVLYLDLDGFKQVNDTHGHEVGDEVLAQVAARFASSVRLSDQIGRLPDEMNISRFGGDEFTVLLSEVNGQQGAETAARRLLRSLEHPLEIDDRKVALGVSIGIAVYPDDGATVDALLRNADAAMYRAKREPGSAYRFHEASKD